MLSQYYGQVQQDRRITLFFFFFVSLIVRRFANCSDSSWTDVKIVIMITFLRNKEHRSDRTEASCHVGLTFNIRMRKWRSTVWRKTSFEHSDGGRQEAFWLFWQLFEMIKKTHSDHSSSDQWNFLNSASPSLNYCHNLPKQRLKAAGMRISTRCVSPWSCWWGSEAMNGNASLISSTDYPSSCCLFPQRRFSWHADPRSGLWEMPCGCYREAAMAVWGQTGPTGHLCVCL